MLHYYKLTKLGGDLNKQIDLCAKRMGLSDYSADNIFQPKSYEWYGDWEGRTLLAMQCLYNYLGVEPKYYKEINDAIPMHINWYGYFGPVVDKDNINEQQFAGNSWYLRYLCSAYENNKNENILSTIHKLTNNLYIKHKTEISNYIYNSKMINDKDFATGHLSGKVGNWNLSSDVGCIFISLDGLSHSYQITKDKNTEDLIDSLVDIFSTIGTTNNNMQTHAFLSGIRGLVRYYESTKKPKVLNLAKEYFDYYLKSSINFVYENFGVINKYCGSEGCAVIDSAMLCIQFFNITNDNRYLSLFRKIYENAIRVAQRGNGGFGCNVGVWENNYYLESVKEFAEANWCCTMRGCEGMTYIAQNLFSVRDNTITVILPNDCIAEFFNGKVVLKVKTDYPNTGKTTFEVLKCNVPFTLNFNLLDSYKTNANKTEFKFEKPSTVVVEHTGIIVKRVLFNKNGYEYGDMVLAEALTSDNVFEIDGKKMQRLISFASVKIEDTFKIKQRVLF